ncbi:helix-turn-helix domain-containing protein, partial [Micromonospora sp. NPDC049799]|uniref:helix-turn-helix domain-containing protein n=1 Tax=Micromonospora sp. NPDC049799 TaxID=3154741 RepID=UPI0033EE2B04
MDTTARPGSDPTSRAGGVAGPGGTGASPAGTDPAVSTVGGETAQTLDRGLRLLHLVADAPGGLTVTEAANRLGIGRAAVYRLVGPLTGHGEHRVVLQVGVPDEDQR